MSQICLATDRDQAPIHALLGGSGLPTADLAVAQPIFIVALDGSEIAGVAALDPYGATALVRSVAAAPAARNQGLGHALVERLEAHARTTGIAQLVLLTETAKPFFERAGYVVIDRASAPAAVQSSAEFRSLCPQSAICMSKRL